MKGRRSPDDVDHEIDVHLEQQSTRVMRRVDLGEDDRRDAVRLEQGPQHRADRLDEDAGAVVREVGERELIMTTKKWSGIRTQRFKPDELDQFDREIASELAAEEESVPDVEPEAEPTANRAVEMMQQAIRAAIQ